MQIREFVVHSSGDSWHPHFLMHGGTNQHKREMRGLNKAADNLRQEQIAAAVISSPGDYFILSLEGAFPPPLFSQAFFPVELVKEEVWEQIGKERDGGRKKT